MGVGVGEGGFKATMFELVVFDMYASFYVKLIGFGSLLIIKYGPS